MSTCTSAWRSIVASSGALEKVLTGVDTAPMRVMAAHATTQPAPLGSSVPTWLPLPTPSPTRRAARAAERRSSSA